MAYGPFFAGSAVLGEEAALAEVVKLINSGGGFDIALADSDGNLLCGGSGGVLVGDLKVALV